MGEIDDLHRELDVLRARNAELELRRVASEEAGRKSEARFRALLERTTEILSLTAADGSTLYMSLSAVRLLGWTEEEMAGRTSADLVLPEDRAHFITEIRRLISGELTQHSFEYRVRHRDGSVRWLESSGSNLLDDPDVRAIVGNHRDISARKDAERELRESRNLLEEAQAIAHVGSWTMGIDPPDEVRWSAECYRINGLPVGAPINTDIAIACVHEDDRERMLSAVRAAVEQNTLMDIVHRVTRPDGHVAWIHARAEVERDADGHPRRLTGSTQDITERHLAVEALKASEQRYRRIVENTSQGLWMYDAKGITTFMNSRMAEMLGCTAAEAIGRPVLDFIDESLHDEAELRLEQRRQGHKELGHFRLRRKDGGEVWVSSHASPLYDANGRLEAILGLVTDVGAQRLADEVRARLVAIVESSDDAIVSTTLTGTITSWNLSAQKLYQYEAHEMVGRLIFELTPAPLLEHAHAIFASATRGEAVHHHETERLRKDETLIEVALVIAPIRDATGTVIGVSKIGRDLTARRKTEAALRRTEEQFRQAQKMEAVGRLAGGVAHDFNNLLSVILSYASLAIQELRVGDPLREELEQIHIAGARATALTRQLLAFSRQQLLQPRVIDLHDVVTDMMAMLARLLGEDIELALVVPQKVGRVLADPGQIEQVLMNLAVNARDAMPDGGKLTLEIVEVVLDEAYVDAHLGVATGTYVMLSMSDTGIGMDAATSARIFEPFYTTKATGTGTGLGLSTVFGIVEQSGGHVEVCSEPGRGSTFKVYLPNTDRPVDAVAGSATQTALRGSETILLVEDEEQVRVVACAILRRHGYQVLDASSGDRALQIAKSFAPTVDLLLTDVVMPHMSGRKIAEALAPQRPEMRVLYLSGYTDDAIVRHGVIQEGVAFLHKPFTPESLLRKVREVLDSK